MKWVAALFSSMDKTRTVAEIGSAAQRVLTFWKEKLVQQGIEKFLCSWSRVIVDLLGYLTKYCSLSASVVL